MGVAQRVLVIERLEEQLDVRLFRGGCDGERFRCCFFIATKRGLCRGRRATALPAREAQDFVLFRLPTLPHDLALGTDGVVGLASLMAKFNNFNRKAYSLSVSDMVDAIDAAVNGRLGGGGWGSNCLT